MSGSTSGGHTNPQMSPTEMLDTYNQYLPASLGTTLGQSQNTAMSLAGAASAANPVYTQSGLNQLNEYAGGYQQAGNELTQQQAANTNQLLQGAGGAAARSAAALNNELNPAQAASNTQAANLVNSINLNGLSPGEQNAVERSVGQANVGSGNLGLLNATNTVSNAMNFGNALQAKRTALSSALGAASGVSANQQTQVNPVGTAISAGNASNNFGLGQFNSTQANGNITAPLSYASSFGNQLAGIAGASKGNTSAASGGCYLTTACCAYKGLPDDCEELQVLRKFRDEYVPAILVIEYYKEAPDIVPMLNDSQLKYIYAVITECVSDIKNNRKESALNRYTNMVAELKGT